MTIRLPEGTEAPINDNVRANVKEQISTYFDANVYGDGDIYNVSVDINKIQEKYKYYWSRNEMWDIRENILFGSWDIYKNNELNFNI